jgi:hypothetical protein
MRKDVDVETEERLRAPSIEEPELADEDLLGESTLAKIGGRSYVVPAEEEELEEVLAVVEGSEAETAEEETAEEVTAEAETAEEEAAEEEAAEEETAEAGEDLQVDEIVAEKVEDEDLQPEAEEKEE